ncbi:Inducer of phenazine A [Streptomyces sp. SP18CS02]|uniref:Inducer of phenazine A n=1 Tax=Streptomyces sp. SP18CS02 TaxID=3002531 RepID=UPI002E774D38|nr:Inducer of phenazine A [Streptomyces sp. SP18CS02]MEE1754117.1 Inducer of phenazine A [Streptomyces sp. SP18CS02]
MTSQRELLTPQMLRYDDFDDRAETRYLPYLMYFHRAGYRSETINTDRLGFRISHGADEKASVLNQPKGPVRLLAGSSTPFGIGATSDAATMASRLWSQYAPSVPWLNFAGRSHNSMQELLLFMMHRELLPEVEEIIVFSGLNDLALARLPESQRGEHGGFFNCGEYFDQMEELRARNRKTKLGFGRRSAAVKSENHVVPPLKDRIEYAVDLTSRHLASLQLLAAPTGARITYVLQPLATWVRETGSTEEKAIFGELDEVSNFWELYGDIATIETGRRYADALRVACEAQDVRFLDISPVVADAVTSSDWLYVDRAHFTDHGTEIVSGLLADSLGLS